MGGPGCADVFPIGTRFGLLEISGAPVYDKRHGAKYPVRCVCGDERIVFRYNLICGSSRSCGRPGCRKAAREKFGRVIKNIKPNPIPLIMRILETDMTDKEKLNIIRKLAE